MIYHLAQKLQTSFSCLHLFHYISVRSLLALLTALLFSAIIGQWFLKTSEKNFRTTVREKTPPRHQKKNNTPTMGGLLILLIFCINTLLWNNLTNIKIWIFLFCTLSFGALGLLDDVAKLKTKKGISPLCKFGMQTFFATILIYAWYRLATPNTELCVPFFKTITPTLGIVLIPWGAFILVAMSNAVNLTDGLDGLATGSLVGNFATFSFISYMAGHKYFAQYLHIPFAGTAELAIIGASLIGALLGFLWYNTYPAQIFMGDVGSLALGAALGLMALMARQELLLLIAGGIFVLETLSVVIQISSYRFRSKKVFRMAPIHHHFELLGWNEPKITVRFWIISLILCLLTLLTLKMR